MCDVVVVVVVVVVRRLYLLSSHVSTFVTHSHSNLISNLRLYLVLFIR
jgi:hypothetical protein